MTFGGYLLSFQLKEKLKHYGIENVEDLTLVEDSNNEGMNRGFAFLEFSSRSDAMDAFKRLQKRDVLFGVDRPAKVSFADSFIDPGDEIMAQVSYLDGYSSKFRVVSTPSVVHFTFIFSPFFGAWWTSSSMNLEYEF